MSGYSASEMKECPWTLLDLGACFLIKDAFWTFYTWVFCMLKENREVNPSFPKQEGWGSFLAIKIQKNQKTKFFCTSVSSPGKWRFWCMCDWLGTFPFPSRLPSCTIKAGKLETQRLRLLCSYRVRARGLVCTDPLHSLTAQMWKWAVQEVATGWETGPSGKHEAELLDLLGKWGGILTFSFKYHVWRLAGVSSRAFVRIVLQWIEAFLGFRWPRVAQLFWAWVAFKLDSLVLLECP